MDIKNVTVFGAGVLGAQIAFQTAFHGYKVTLYDIKKEFLENARKRFENLRESYKVDIDATDEDLDIAFNNLSYTTNLAESVTDADITIEAIPENLEVKKEFYVKLSTLAPQKTIFCTNSSTLLPSDFAAETGRPQQFLALHFANLVWKYNIVEIMGHAGTDAKNIEIILAFAKTIGMVPVVIQKENPGYIMNALSVPWLMTALDLLIEGVGDVESIDKTWILTPIGNRSIGPFALLDIIGLTTAYNVITNNAEKTGENTWIKRKEFIRKNFIEPNKLGVSTGEGFYKYPNPSYEQEAFLKP
ncbi:3-hydroxyacyl-CoA dehydrogenase [Olivibacter sp. SDN3]|uniref:3-hydroxyacyl-CoA dehydrogenase n=1 Tax=Sphingobacterium phlebotomi TaxID=2605433 RepID=A0A5D4HD66_9SPHI|nr:MULTISPECIES: 3-hydroxyacyl-CoA dehydrogenase [Sphingobacteriaceae]QNL50339.1 3-hydroxyacyl-CoA dehydrogenase [Olivibacter sp. SDN3]TYR37485.1 3-hydroxyacyl-CoA dehydrogenase [Sphingobacterium phlebotomi]